MTMRCADCRESLNALVDGEIAGDEAEALRDHLDGCAECRREHHLLVETSSVLKEGLVRHAAPDVLKARLRSAIAQSPLLEAPMPARGPSRMSLAAAAVVIAIASSGITLAVARRATPPAVGSEVLASHLRSLMPGHLTDVASTNQHNVKPWFNGRVDFSPAVPNLDSIGFPLLGGRLDYVDGRTVAVTVYGRREHKISVYSWPAARGATAPEERDVRGYHLMTWTAGGISYWAVSDLNPQELAAFVKAFSSES
jgi:anti-sigma factor (TIGR02949 family)